MLELLPLLHWLMPRTCVCCGFNSQDAALDLCKYCYMLLPWTKHACYNCAKEIKDNNIGCVNCLHSKIAYDRVCALFYYQKPLIRLINTLKFRGQLYPANLFASLLCDKIPTWYKQTTLPEVIIPMPIHIDRFRERGYNQAIEIARPLAKALHIPLDITSCVRVTHTKTQAQLHKRFVNVHAAFKVKPLQYQHVAILDDVVTTGNTVQSLSLALQNRGVLNIDIWCVCRA